MNKFITRGIYMTCGINAEIEVNPAFYALVAECVAKHMMNQGEECLKDKAMNHKAIKNKDGRVFSVFTIQGKRVYIITDGLHLADDPEYGKQYPYTTVMFPEEY